MKTLFILSVDHSIDLITNSSSELFVLEGKSIDMVKELVASVYPDYLVEYNEPIHISDLDTDELDSYFSYATGSWSWPATKKDYRIPTGFTFEELYEPESDKPAWNGEIQYKLKNNEPGQRWGSFVTEANREWVLNKLDPERKLYFIYSRDENPDYDKQMELSNIAQRYHLG
jgi:hypothetical protein